MQEWISFVERIGVRRDFGSSRAFPYLIESDDFANRFISDSNYLPMEVGRYVKGSFS